MRGTKKVQMVVSKTKADTTEIKHSNSETQERCPSCTSTSTNIKPDQTKERHESNRMNTESRPANKRRNEATNGRLEIAQTMLPSVVIDDGGETTNDHQTAASSQMTQNDMASLGWAQIVSERAVRLFLDKLTRHSTICATADTQFWLMNRIFRRDSQQFLPEGELYQSCSFPFLLQTQKDDNGQV